MNRIEHHLLNMYVITKHLLRLRKHHYLKRSIYFCQYWTKSSQERESPNNLYKTPSNVLELGRLTNYPFGSLREELF